MSEDGAQEGRRSQISGLCSGTDNSTKLVPSGMVQDQPAGWKQDGRHGAGPLSSKTGFVIGTEVD